MTATELLGALEAAGARVEVEAGRVRLVPGSASPALISEARAAVRELAHELRARRLAEILVSRRRCAAAAEGLEGNRSTVEAGRAWVGAADAFVRGSMGREVLDLAEAAVIAAWSTVRSKGLCGEACADCGTREGGVFIELAGDVVCGRCWRGETRP